MKMAATGTTAKASSPVATSRSPATSMMRAPKRSARLPAMGEKIATIISATDWPEPIKVFDQPNVLAHSSVMTETDWRADMTMESVAKHSHTMIQGLMRDFVVMDTFEHGSWGFG